MSYTGARREFEPACLLRQANQPEGPNCKDQAGATQLQQKPGLYAAHRWQTN